MTRPLALALAALLAGCANPPPAPKELPHYPCTSTEKGRTVYRACSVHEWLEQQNPKGSK